MINQPIITLIPEENKVMLIEDYILEHNNIKIVVPKYFKSDGASIPWYGQRLTYTPFHPLCLGPAIAHDWLDINHQVSFKDAANILYDLLILNDANRIKSKIIYKSVLFGGRKYWDHTQKDIESVRELYEMCRKSERFNEYHFPEYLI